LQLPVAFEFGLELGAEQQGEVSDPQPTRKTMTPASDP
jgi:hypothetical protein